MANVPELIVLRRLIRERYGKSRPGGKVARYVDKFFDAELRGGKLIAKVVGNHGTYTVSIALDKDNTGLISACSCYIGKHGGCHHVAALAHAFLRDESQFQVIDMPKLTGASLVDDATNFDELRRALRDTSLDSLLQQLREAGITQKAFAEAMGMKPSMLTVYKSSEARHHYFSELGAVKLACLWMLQRSRKRNWKG
jgi:hypothetical protein